MVSLEVLPNEVQDRIFELVEDPRLLYPLLFSKRLHSSVVRAIYRDLHLDVYNDPGPNGLTFHSESCADFTTDGIAPMFERLRRIDSMIASQGSRLSRTRFLTVSLLSEQFVRTIRINGRWPGDFTRYFVAPDDYPHSRNHGPEFKFDAELSIKGAKRRCELPGTRWGNSLARILRQMPDLESLSCDVFPYMWKDLTTYETIPGLQNLHTLSLHGVGVLDIRLSALPKLRKLKLNGLYIRRSDFSCGVTDLEVVEDSGLYDHRHGTPSTDFHLLERSYRTCFHLLSFTALIRLSVTCSKSDKYANQTLRACSLFANVQACAATLKTLELHIIDKWVSHSPPCSGKIVPLPSLTTLVIPWSKLGMAGRLPGVDTSNVRTLEVQLVDPFFPFGHEFALFVTDPKIKKAFPSLGLFKITVREPGNKKWHVTTKLILEYLEAETADGTFLGCPVVKSDPSLTTSIVNGRFVMDFSDLLRELLLHDSRYCWPARA